MEQGVAHIPPPRELPGTDVKSYYVIVGDGAFPLTEHLQRPYCRRNMEEREMVYNYRLSLARRVTENSLATCSSTPTSTLTWSWPAVCCIISCVGGAARATSLTSWGPTLPRPQQPSATSCAYLSGAGQETTKCRQVDTRNARRLFYGVWCRFVATQNVSLICKYFHHLLYILITGSLFIMCLCSLMYILYHLPLHISRSEILFITNFLLPCDECIVSLWKQ